MHQRLHPRVHSPIHESPHGVDGGAQPPGAPTISGAPSIGSQLTITDGTGVTTSRHLIRGGVDVGAVTSGYTYVAADVGPTIAVVPYNGALAGPSSNVLQYALRTMNLKGDWDGVTPSHYHLTAGRVDTLYDQSGNSNDLAQADPAAQPVIASAGGPDGVKDAINFALLASATTALSKADLGLGANPVSIYTITQSPPDADNYLCDGASADSRIVIRDAGAMKIYAGSAFTCAITAPAIGTWFVHAAVFNGASSKTSINGGAAATGSPGSGTNTGHKWGGGVGVQGANCKMQRQLVYAEASSDTDRLNISAYLKWWGGVP